MSDICFSPLVRRLRATAGSMSRSDPHLRIMTSHSMGEESGESPSIGRIIDLPRIPDPRGNLTFVEGHRHVPFEIRRAYYLYDVPGGSSRGGHGHKALHQFVIAIAGSFDITLDDGVDAELYPLNRSYYGLYIPPMTWRELDNFSSGAVCLVLASEVYDESDYFRTYDAFVEAVRCR